MKVAKVYNFFVILLLVVFSTQSSIILATELDSTNYKLVGVTTTTGGGLGDSTNYSLITVVGEISANPSNYSTNYKLNQDPSANFVAAVPSIQCFETDTDGTTNCTSGPDELLSGGMTAICGSVGCYDKARFEINNKPTTLDANTVGSWSFEQTSYNGTPGEILDSSIYNNNGKSNSSTTLVTGISGKGIHHGSGTSATVVDSASLDITNQLTIAYWFKPDVNVTSMASNYPLGVFKRNWQIGGYGSHFVKSTGKVNFQWCWSGGCKSLDSTTVFLAGNWYYYTATYDGTTARLYINGVQESSATISTPMASSAGYPLSLGNSEFEGIIDEVRISKVARTQEEITKAYSQGLGEGINPSDTLYSVQISTDNFVNDVKCIDGSTFMPKSSSCNINDFRTESYWENETFNVKGLSADTQYYLRITALHGDFTQSNYSQISSATTSEGYIFFDIDIASSTGTTTESASPYSISFSGSQKLIAGAAATTSTSLIWLDLESSATGGVAVIQFGKYGGLYSSTTSQTILSSNENLDNQSEEGFGLQSYYIDYDDSSSFYGDLVATTNYAGTVNTVGAVSTTANKIYQGDGPIVGGRMGMYVKARAGTNKSAATDYSEEIHFIIVPMY